jgi:hypothetical protein
MAYLGKISAVVGVSTGDFESKLNRCASEVTNFSNKVVRSLAATSGQTGASFDQMYTKAQRFERMLRAATSGKLDFAGLKNFPGKTLEEAAASMRKMESVAFSMTAPIAQIAKQTETMSASMREAFAPALIKAQAEAERLRDKLSEVGQTVTQGELLEGEKQVERLADAFRNLGEAAQMAGKLSSGKGFRFSQPVAYDELSRASSADAKVTALPAHQMTPSLVKLIQEQKAAADAVAQYNAALQSSPSAEAQAALNARVVALRDVTEEINRQIAVYDKLDTQAATIKRTTAAFEELRSSAAGALSGLPQNLDQAKTKYDQIVASLGRLSEEQKKAFAPGTSGGHAVDSLAGAVTSEKESQLPKALKLIGEISEQIDGMHKMDVGAKEAAAETERLQQSIEKIISTYIEMGQTSKFAFTGQAQNIKQASQQFDQMVGAIGRLPSATRAATAEKVAGPESAARAIIASGDKDQMPDLVTHLNAMKKELDLLDAEDAATKRLIASHQELKRAANASAAAQDKITTEETDRLQRSIEGVATAYIEMGQEARLAFTGEAQSIKQASQQRQQILSQVGSMAPASRAFASAKMEDLDSQARAMISSGNKDQLPDINDRLDKMKQVVADQIAADAAMKDTAEEATKLKKALESSAAAAQKNADALAQAFTGQAQNVDQVSSAYGTLISRIEKLTDAQRAQLQATHGSSLANVGNSIARPDGPDGAMSPQQLSDAQLDLASAGLAVDMFEEEKKKAKELEDAVTSLNKKLGDISKSIGRPADPIDELDAAAKKATADVEKMTDPKRKARAEAALANLQGRVTTVQGMSGDAAAKAPAMSQLAGKAGIISDFANQKQAKDIFGPAFGSAEKNLANLKSKIVSVGTDLDKLPIPLQTKLAPAIAKVRQMFVDMGKNPTAAQLKQAAAEAEKLEKRIGRLSQALKFKGKFSDFIDENSGKAYEAQLASIQQRFLALGAAASGPTAAAINQYRTALARASAAGTLGTKAVRDQMEQLAASIAKAAQAEGLLNKGQAASFLAGLKKNFGDVGRGGADKFALGMNQAAFAIDDFMSATGGIDQKIRAISNNITQLGFVVGGNKGLYMALAAVITSHVVIAYMKFIEGGRTAEDKSKALNDALSKQKSLVEELANAYESLAKEMAKSSDASKGVERADKIGKYLDAKRSASAKRSSDFAEGVINESTLQSSLDRRMKSATTAGQVIALRMATESSQARERVARGTASSLVPTIDASEVGSLRNRRARLQDELTNSAGAQFREATGFDLSYSHRKFRLAAEKSISDLDAMIKKFEDSVSAAADKLAENIVVSSLKVSDKIEAAQAQVADAIAKGVVGASAFQAELDSAGRALSNAMMALYDAAKEEDPAARTALTQQARQQYDAAVAGTAGVAARSREMRLRNGVGGERAANALSAIEGNANMRNESAGKTAALQAAVSDEKAARDAHAMAVQQSAAATALADKNMRDAKKQVSDASKAQRIAEEDLAAKEAFKEANKTFDPRNPDSWSQEANNKQVEEARRQLEAAKEAVQAAKDQQIAVAITAGAQTEEARAAQEKAAKELEAAQAAAEFAAAVAEAAIAMEEAVSRIRKINSDTLSAATSTADAAQKRYTDAPSEKSKRERDAAEERLINDKERVAQAENALSRARTEAESSPEIKAYNQRIEQLRAQRKKLEEDAKLNGTTADQGKMEDLANEEASVNAQREREMRRQTAGAQERADRVAQDVAAEGRRQEAVDREKERVKAGKELAMTESQRRKKAATDEAEILGGAAGEITDAGKRSQFVQDYFNNKKKEIQTTLKGYEDERTNAIMGGPSRAALNASDVTTSAGSSELNRLLRGDDASKDVNFAEMKHQSELLAEIRDGIRDATGIIVN